jgi:hypothetical protein
MWRKTPPLTETECADIADLLAPVGQILAMQRGVPDGARLVRLYDRLVKVLGLTMPAPVLPDKCERHYFLSDDEIDFALDQIESAARTCDGRVLADVIDAERQLTCALLAMRRRENF